MRAGRARRTDMLRDRGEKERGGDHGVPQQPRAGLAQLLQEPALLVVAR